MKIYNWKQLKEICGQQGYKLAKLEDSQGNNMTSYNKITYSITKQFLVIQNRLRSEILPDGIYYVCLATKINNSNNPDRYPIQKGRASNVPEIINRNVLNDREHFTLEKNNLLTQESALKMLTEISDLKAQVRELQIENNYLQLEIEELTDGKGLDEDEKDSPLIQFAGILKEQAPTIVASVSEYFKLQNRKVDLQEKELELKLKNTGGTKKEGFQEVKVGTPAHVAVIKMYSQKGNEKKFNEEMEKLKPVNKKLYDQLVKELVGEEEEEEED